MREFSSVGEVRVENECRVVPVRDLRSRLSVPPRQGEVVKVDGQVWTVYGTTVLATKRGTELFLDLLSIPAANRP